MGSRKIVRCAAAVVLVAAAVLLAACSKHSSQEFGAPRSVALGTVELVPDKPTRLDLGSGTTCVITATQLDPTLLQLVAYLENSGRKSQSIRMAPITLDQPLALSLRNIRIEITPHLK